MASTDAPSDWLCLPTQPRQRPKQGQFIYTSIYFWKPGGILSFYHDSSVNKNCTKKTFEAAVHLQTTLRPFLKLLTFTLSYPF